MAETPTRIAGRISNEEWIPFVAKAAAKGETVTDIFRRAILNYTNDADTQCKHCKSTIEYFKGHWWLGNDFMCPDGENPHEPELSTTQEA